MHEFDNISFRLLTCLVFAMFFSGGCSPKENDSNHDPNEQGGDDASVQDSIVPKEHLTHSFMNPFECQLIGQHYNPSVYTGFPPEAAETEEARKLVLWHLSKKDVIMLKDPEIPDGDLKRVRIRLFGKEKDGNRPSIAVYTNGHVGSSVEVIVGYPGPGRRFETVRLFVANEEVVQRINELFNMLQSTPDGTAEES